MRKALLIVATLSLTFWSAGLAEAWMGDHVHQITVLLIIGGCFYMVQLLFSSAAAFFSGFAFSRGEG